MDGPTDLSRYELLEIPEDYRPPTHYQLLGVEDFEDDLQVIEAAIKQRIGYLHQIATGPNRKAVQELLNEVATAKRNLLNADSKSAYDQELLALIEEDQPQQFPAAVPDEDVPRTTRRRRKKSAWDEWKYHLASAALCLSVVGIVWFVNRKDGERRAAKAPSTASQSKSPNRRSAATTAKPASRPKQSDRVAAARRQSKRIDQNLAPVFEGFDSDTFVNPKTPKMSDPNATGEDAKKQSSPSKASTPAKDSPKAKINQSSKTTASEKRTETLNLAANWNSGLKSLKAFDGKLDAQFRAISGSKLSIKDKKLVIAKETDPKKRFQQLTHKRQELRDGISLALTTNLRANDSNTSMAIVVGGNRIVVVATPKGIAVRGRPGKAGSKSTDLGLLPKTDGPLVFLIQRAGANQVRWLVKSGKANVSGLVRFKAPLKGKVTLAIGAPQKDLDPPLHIASISAGKAKNIPWKKTVPVEI